MQNTTDLWYLLPPNIAARPRQSAVFFGLGRLRSGVSPAQARAALSVVAERLALRYSFDRRKGPIVEGLDAIAHEPARRTMGLLISGVGTVFLVGCVNIAILMGAEGRRRRREIAIRAALGARPWRLWRDVSIEKLLLTVLSLAFGVALAFALLRVLTRLIPAAGLGPPLTHSPPLRLNVMFIFGIFSLGVATIWSALLVTAAKGSVWSRGLFASGDGLGYTGLSDSSTQAGRWRLVLLATQTATGVCLLAIAALTVSTYFKLSAANLGPAPRHTVLFSVSPQDNIILTDAQAAEFNQELFSRLQRLPGTRAIALADLFPPPGFPVSFLKQVDAPETERDATWPISVSPSYFRAFGIPILFGRGFDVTDNSHSERVAIISLEMAQRNWSSPELAVGSLFAFGSKFEKPYKIVGVAGNFGGYWYDKPAATVYLPEAQVPNWCGEVILRTAGSPRAVAALAPQALVGMAIPAKISNVTTMQDRWQATLTRPLARMVAMLLLALLGMALSTQGVYAVAAATVSSRRHELAVRSALGAHPTELAWNVTRELVIAVLAGIGFGTAAALDMRGLLERWLGPLTIRHVEPLVLALAIVALAAAAGCYVPARAAMRANPIDVLRNG